jgi:hypothetical protein
VTAFLHEHDLDRDVVVSEDASAGRVFAGSDYPIIVTGFGRWADKIEQGFHDAVRAVAPAAQVDFRWSFEDEDDWVRPTCRRGDMCHLKF